MHAALRALISADFALAFSIGGAGKQPHPCKRLYMCGVEPDAVLNLAGSKTNPGSTVECR